LDLLVSHDLVNDQLSGCPALQNSLYPRLLENGAHPTLLVINEQNLRSAAVNHAQDLAHDTVGGDDWHFASDSIGGSFVYIDEARMFAAARANDLRGSGLANELFFESQEGLQPMGLVSILL